jgi:hypothetical protein
MHVSQHTLFQHRPPTYVPGNVVRRLQDCRAVLESAYEHVPLWTQIVLGAIVRWLPSLRSTRAAKKIANISRVPTSTWNVPNTSPQAYSQARSCGASCQDR